MTRVIAHTRGRVMTNHVAFLVGLAQIQALVRQRVVISQRLAVKQSELDRLEDADVAAGARVPDQLDIQGPHFFVVGRACGVGSRAATRTTTVITLVRFDRQNQIHLDRPVYGHRVACSEVQVGSVLDVDEALGDRLAQRALFACAGVHCAADRVRAVLFEAVGGDQCVQGLLDVVAAAGGAARAG